MSPPRDFADYPIAVEGPDVPYRTIPEKNPALRGLPLLALSNVVARVDSLKSILYGNTGYGIVKDMPELDTMPMRFHPVVTPLGDTTMLDFEPELLKTSRIDDDKPYYSASDYHDMYKSGKVTPLQVAETLLAAIKQDQKPAGIYADAWVSSYGKDSLVLDAARASTKRYASGEPLSVLDGVPIGVKDDTPVEGYVSHMGMAYKEGARCFKPKEETQWCVQKLQHAGAVVIGKNRMHELGSDTSGLNASQGTPTNHVNKSYYPGGSSSGGASSVGAGIVPMVIGTDAGGSIRIPACYNGVYGLKPSHHRTGVFSVTTGVWGPIAATTADLTIMYRLMSQPDPECPIQSRYGVSKPPGPGAPRVMGVFRDWWAEAEPRVVEICDKAVDHFAKKRGYDVVDISIPFMTEGRAAHSVICIAELAEIARRSPENPADWHTLVASPNKIVLGIGAQVPAADYLKSNALRELFMRHMAGLFRKYPGLLIMTPTSPWAGWPRQPGDEAYGVSDANKSVANMAYVFLANLTGLPSLSAPVGYVDPDQGEGELPIGLMATGEWGAEEQLLAWAREAEEDLNDTVEDGRRMPKTWFDVLGQAQE